MKEDGASCGRADAGSNLYHGLIHLDIRQHIVRIDRVPDGKVDGPHLALRIPADLRGDGDLLAVLAEEPPLHPTRRPRPHAAVGPGPLTQERGAQRRHLLQRGPAAGAAAQSEWPGRGRGTEQRSRGTRARQVGGGCSHLGAGVGWGDGGWAGRGGRRPLHSRLRGISSGNHPS